MSRRPFARLGAALALLLSVAGPAAAASALRPFDAASPATIRAEQAGKPFVLAFWSVTCEPCREEMGEWGRWARAHPGVAVVLVATDPASQRAAVDRMLRAHDMRGVQTLTFADEYTERVRHAIDPRWRGELPRTYFLDAAHRAEARTGKLDARWTEAWFARHDPKQPASPRPGASR